MKINEIDVIEFEFCTEELARILQDYDHPHFDIAFQQLEEKEFYVTESNQSDK